MPLNLKSIFSAGAEKLVSAVGDAFDKNFTNKEEKEAAKLAVMQEINRHLEALQVNVNKETELILGDKDSARNMQIEALKQTDLFSKRYLYYFSTFWSLFSGAYLAGVTFVEIPANNIRVVDTVLGFILGTAIALMFSYFYGASLKTDKPIKQH